MSSIQTFLKPLSEDKPAGEDLTWDTSLSTIRTLAKPKITQRVENGKQVSSSEEPDFRKLLSACETALARSRDLQVGMHYCIARTEIDGLSGAVEGVELLNGMLTAFWPHVYPIPEDGAKEIFNQRRGIIENLSQKPKPASEDPYRFIIRLKKTRLVGKVTLQEYERTRASGVAPDVIEGFQAMARDAGKNTAAITNCSRYLNRMDAAIEGIQNFFLDQGSSCPKLTELTDCVAAIRAMLARVFPDTPAAAAAPEASENHVSQEQRSAVEVRAHSEPVRVGTISSHQDVIRSIDAICAFYEKAEPASPVPLLLQRAKRLVGKSFLDVMQDIAASGIDEVKKLAGMANTSEENN